MRKIVKNANIANDHWLWDVWLINQQMEKKEEENWHGKHENRKRKKNIIEFERPEWKQNWIVRECVGAREGPSESQFNSGTIL